MRLGVVARGEDRGLGILTWEVVRHMAPDRVLLVDMGPLARGFPLHRERYDDSIRTDVKYDDGHLNERVVRAWLEGLDVIYTAETWYDQRLAGWANLAGVRTVLHAMPEFLAVTTPRPTSLWLPTPWRREAMGAHHLVPIPVATERIPVSLPSAGPLRVLHVAGHAAAADRNGTAAFIRAIGLLHERVEVTVIDQDSRAWQTARPAPYVTLKVRGPEANYWDIYREQDVLVMPRRYGGLCLPVQEAMAAALAVVMTDMPPNDWWPTMRVRCQQNGRLQTPGGTLRIGLPMPHAIAEAIDTLARDRGLLERQQRASFVWSREHSWERLFPLWTAELERC